MWIRVFPDKPLTKKPAETRMGKGKGAPEVWVAVVKPGRVLFEMEGVSEETAREAFRLDRGRVRPAVGSATGRNRKMCPDGPCFHRVCHPNYSEGNDAILGNRGVSR